LGLTLMFNIFLTFTTSSLFFNSPVKA
jgi:hypothetical protein